MNLSPADLDELANLAIAAAAEAGQMIAESRPREIQHKDTGAGGGESAAAAVVTEVDRRSENIILDVLRPTLQRFELGLLTEEQDDDRSRLSAEHFWSIDPLDGTLPFIEASSGSGGYAVSIALVGRDGVPWIGVVYDPVEATTLHAIRGAGIFRDGQPWSAESQAEPEVLSVFADRSLVERDDYQLLLDDLGLIAREMGLDGVRVDATRGAVMNACGVLTNPRACYFKHPKRTGGGSLWDFAATACLFHESGAVATDIEGGSLDLNREDATNMAHRGVLFASNEALAARIRTLRSG